MTIDQAAVRECADNAATQSARAEDFSSTLHQAADQVPQPGVVDRLKVPLRVNRTSIVLAASLVLAAVLAMVVYLAVYRPARQTDPAAADEAVRAASSATVALLSYGPESLEQDMDRARTLMTGEFLTYYSKFNSDVVAPAVRTRRIQAAAQVVDAGLMEIAPRDAKVLIFLNQETVSRERPDPALAASSVVVSLTKVDQRWLISALDPV